MNDDRGLAATGGYIVANGWVSQGAFAVEAVDKAVFEKMQPGEVSDIITGPDSTLYVVKLEEIKPGAVRPFTDFEVQQEIQDKLEVPAVRGPPQQARRRAEKERHHPHEPDDVQGRAGDDPQEVPAVGGGEVRRQSGEWAVGSGGDRPRIDDGR